MSDKASVYSTGDGKRPGLCSNTDDGLLSCHLCDWQKQCNGMEQIEFEAMRHLRDSHGLAVLYRTDDATGKRTEIPQ